jgi:hypothetical protein
MIETLGTKESQFPTSNYQLPTTSFFFLYSCSSSLCVLCVSTGFPAYSTPYSTPATQAVMQQAIIPPSIARRPS